MLKLENVSKYYYSSSSVTCALRKINLKFDIGEFVAITGESGSGKTTLLNIISGLDSYEDGELFYYDKKTSFFDDEDWENYRKNEIAFIFQNYNLIDSYTVIENVIVSYIIDGYSYKEAKKKAKETLKLVGLENDYYKKATKLSGGQKQRLSIARALAKETNIIVADEPTGNLDVENGNAILELLKKISKNKLVIVVSHNFAQIEPFITRKIRLHDGEVVLDEKVVSHNIYEQVVRKKEVCINDGKKVLNFSFLNTKSQPKKTILMMLLVIICVFSSFLFYANFKANLDENKTKILESDFFLNFDDTRLIVRNIDSQIITNEMLEKANVKKVVSVEKYDYITDVNYFRLGDYKYDLKGGLTDESVFIDSSAIVLVKSDKFMRSASSLNEKSLKAGKLPTGNLQMVVYSNDEKILGTTEKVLFKNSRKWGVDAYLTYDVEIVGILKDNTNQAYFSDDLCKIMELSEQELDISLGFYKQGKQFTRYKFNKIAVDFSLEGKQIIMTEGIRNALSDPKHQFPDGLIKVRQNSIDTYFNFELNLAKIQNICEDAIVMSPEAFEIIYEKYNLNNQFSIFIEDYSYTEDVIRKLAKENFIAISCFRSSVAGYDTGKVIIRYANLLISLVALLLINLIIVFIGLSILKFKRNDYIIFKMIGLTNKLINKINVVELLFYTLTSNILLVITFSIINNTTTNQLILNVFKYIKLYDFLLVLFISLLSMLSLARKFNKFLNNKTKITVLKEE